MSIHVFSLLAKFSQFQDACLCISQHFQQLCSLHTAIKDLAIDFVKSYDLWNYRSLEITFSIILVLLFVIPFWTSSSSRPLTKDSQRARTALQALQTVLVPSCSLWPARYIKLVKHAPNHRTGPRIVIPLSMLLQDVCDGVIELRDPLYDLEDMMDEGVCAYGCSINLKVEWKWWVEWLDRMLRVRVPGEDMRSCPFKNPLLLRIYARLWIY
ncbi:hypothetical protein P692DRAFT_20411058 [Suillus brevipes Sb2]|nr:hypothetical protein P692DRAFT_20411058 [Suillus brevipes Sb2]